MFAWEGISNVDSYLNDWGFNTIRVPIHRIFSHVIFRIFNLAQFRFNIHN